MAKKIMVCIFILLILTGNLFALFNKKEVKKINTAALVSVAAINSINMDMMYDMDDGFDDDFMDDDDEDEYEEESEEDIVVDIILGTDEEEEEEYDMQVDVDLDLYEAADVLKDEIITGYTDILSFSLSPEDQVLSNKELLKIESFGDAFTAEGYPYINSLSMKDVKRAVKAVSGVDAVIIVQATYNFHVYKQINEKGYGRVQCNFVFEVYNTSGKKVIANIVNESSANDFQFIYGNEYEVGVLNPLCIEATEAAVDEMADWLAKQMKKL